MGFDFTYFSDMSSESSPESNITCNILVSRNNTLVVIQRGWEGIPESIVLNLTICLIFIVIFVIIRQLARNRQNRENPNQSETQKTTNEDSWLKFIYGDPKYDTNGDKRAKTLAPIPYHSHELNDSQMIFPPTFSHHSSTNQTTDEVIDPTTDSNGDDVSNDTIHIHFSRGSHQNLVEVGSDIRDNTLPNSNGLNGNSNHLDSNLLHSVISRSTESIRKYSHWVLDMIFISDDTILRTKGRDAYQYLVFQRYIMYFLTLLSFVCIVIVLPVNIQGDFEGESKAFGKTTISNLEETSDLFWIHAILAAIIMPIGVFMMNHFSKVIKSDEEQITRRTLLIRRIPKLKNTKEIILNYFRQSFPDCVPTGIQLVYDFIELQSLELEFNNVLTAKQYCEKYNAQSTKGLTIRPYCLGQLGCCCVCCCKSTDGFEYYSTSEHKISADLKQELVKTFSNPSGSLFITFETEKQAMEIYKYLKERQNTCICCLCIVRGIDWISNKFNPKELDSLELNRWQVSYAPYPDDMNWKDLTVDYRWIWLRKFAIYLFLFIIFFFLSTPSILLKVMEFMSISDGKLKINSTFSDFLSPLLLMLMTIVLPVIVTAACERLPYKTISALNHAVMWKVYVFLLMMVIILPSAGFLSVNALLDNFFSTDKTKRFRWQCLFPVDNGAFFVNYALQAALLGNTVEILRLPELFLYLIYYLLSRSSAEYKNARKQVSFDFPFGVSYPRFLLIFAMTVTYSLACPLIAPCGLLYMICKHIVDRYNIYYIYTPTKINGRIHSTAVLYVHIALLMMQFQVFTFLLMRTKSSKVTAFSLIVLLIALLVFAGHCFFHWFRNINHLTYSVTTKLNKKRRKRDYCACAYTPPVFSDLITDGIVTKEELSNNGHNS